MGFFYFIIMIGALVFFHELGHFLVAKAFDVKVERFSIGFGPKLFGFWYGETEYVICVLPLGGYVQMLGGDFADAETISEEEAWTLGWPTMQGPYGDYRVPQTGVQLVDDFSRNLRTLCTTHRSVPEVCRLTGISR